MGHLLSAKLVWIDPQNLIGIHFSLAIRVNKTKTIDCSQHKNSLQFSFTRFCLSKPTSWRVLLSFSLLSCSQGWRRLPCEFCYQKGWNSFHMAWCFTRLKDKITKCDLLLKTHCRLWSGCEQTSRTESAKMSPNLPVDINSFSEFQRVLTYFPWLILASLQTRSSSKPGWTRLTWFCATAMVKKSLNNIEKSQKCWVKIIF